MTYRLIYTHRAIRDIERLDPPVKERIGKTLRRFGRTASLAPIGFGSAATESYSTFKEGTSLY